MIRKPYVPPKEMKVVVSAVPGFTVDGSTREKIRTANTQIKTLFEKAEVTPEANSSESAPGAEEAQSSVSLKP